VIERYPFHERICHWLTGFAYIYCLATGLAFYTPYLFWIAVVLGGAPTSRFWHPVTGLVFFGAAMWMHHIWRGDVALGPEDKEWLDKAKFYVTNEDEKVPPQGKYNAGQKIFYWAMYFGAMLLLLSGALMWFLIHVYMGVFMVPGGVEAMLHGSVTKDWAKAHHRLWFHQKTGE
jgi:formate dehydrogenase subunit gamma